MLEGSTYATCEGTYVRSSDLIQGRDVWDRVAPDNARLIFWCGGHWKVTSSDYRAAMIATDGRGCGGYISSDDGAAEWYDADWTTAGATVRLP